ncbi:hypothetical protein P3102_10465 [Amycolatopsis sp. QT-25]|uniref:hypothetical protein n=1 Tax=Amycolatopsis sp. QT-25 TaxID=3034022 RepID=UPI0023EAE896|nr:hypothetical protein [Amycolatopsis sp. QT-25]WET81602.1 hypothetical protein P3102_10465 [Amycolatopsis sp. QT-25]
MIPVLDAFSQDAYFWGVAGKSGGDAPNIAGENVWVQNTKKPYVLGEFGVIKSVYGSDVPRAAFAMRGTQIASCAEEARGWIFWTWDTADPLAHPQSLFTLSQDPGAIDGQFASVV